MPPQILQNSQYDSFAATRMHSHANGMAMMATAGLFPQQAQVVAMHGGMDYDVIAYVAVRRAEPPKVPSPYTTNPNRVFLKGGRVGTFPIYDMGNIAGYAVSGWILFGILSPEGLASTFMLGNLPFPGFVNTDENIPLTYFSYGLINDRITELIPGSGAPSLPRLLRGISDAG